ncbi:MAG TPA: amino acid permease [Caulobacteraceae bacterium]|nr:amino acid permease [Caulobacteraceae bacterium]
MAGPRRCAAQRGHELTAESGLIAEPHTEAAPKRHLGTLHATVLALGMIMTTDTLKTAPTVALNIGTWHFYATWVLGGLISMVGALCYVEMATAFPDPGGDYNFLRKAYGRDVGLLFAWSRFSVMHTGWMALMAFMFSDYAGDLFGLGHGGRTIFALATVAALMGLNLMHVRRGFVTQAGLVGLVTVGFAAVVAAAVKLGLTAQLPHAATSAPTGAPGLDRFTVALIYIFLAYGGWSDAATLSAEVRSDRRGMLVAIMGSLAALMAIYLALNAAMMIGLTPAGLAASSAPAADLMGRAFGPAGKTLIVAVVGVSAIASINSTLIVGARTTYAAARDIPRLGAIGRWDEGRGVPARAVLLEGGFAMALVIAGGFAPSGFNAMVDYMTPVYWLFVMLSMGALIILRRRHPEMPRPVKTPLFPLFPALFMLVSLYMFVAGLMDLGVAALYGAGVMVVGVVLLVAANAPRRRVDFEGGAA